MANSSRTQGFRTDGLSITIGVIVIIVLVIMVIAIVIVLMKRSGFFDTPPTTPQETNIRPTIWGLPEYVSPCVGYRIPPINDTTPANSTNYSADLSDLNPIPGGFSPCLWQDEINRRDERMTCLSEVCTDQFGVAHNRGDTITYPTYCEINSRCTGKLGVIAVSNGEQVDESQPGYNCISSSDIGVIDLESCTLFDYNQYFIMESLSSDAEYIVRLSQRDLGYVLAASGDTVVLQPNQEVINTGFYWIVIPSMYIQEGTTAYYSPAQIGYIGDIPFSIVSEPSNYSSATNIRNFMLKYGVRTLDGNLRLVPWKYAIDDNRGTPDMRSYDFQASAFTSINRMDEIKYQLS
jgi:hypothetical protein